MRSTALARASASVRGLVQTTRLRIRPAQATAARLQELRTRVNSLPPLPAGAASDAEAFWIDYRQRVRDHIQADDPRRFLRWPVIRGAMFVLDESYLEHEVQALRGDSDWHARWRPAVAENILGDPERSWRSPASSGNLLHHAYHLLRYERATGRNAANLRSVLEFGGGYGSMCRLFHGLGFSGNYAILDLPEFSALQRFYLGELGIPASPEYGARVELAVEPGRFRDLQVTKPPPDLLMATWSLSETPLEQRATFVHDEDHCSSYLIAYQEAFEDVDNVAYFAEFRQRRPGVEWREEPLEHMPGHRYLFGVRR